MWNVHESLRPSRAMVSFFCALGVVVVVGLVYLPVLSAGYANEDDHHYLFGVGHVWSPGWQELADVFTRGRVHHPSATSGYYQPLVALSFMADASLTSRSEARWFQFHMTNLCLHVINVVLLYSLLRRLSSSIAWPILLSLVFAVHPVQAASVAWVSMRMTLLGGTFALLALGFYVRYAESLRWRWMCAVVVSYCAAILCGPAFIVLPLVFLALDAWPHRRYRVREDGVDRRSWLPLLEKIPLMTVTCAGIGIQALIHLSASTGISAAEALARAPLNVASLTRRLLWPVDLSPHGPAVAPAGGSVVSIVIGTGLIVLLAAVLLWSFRRSRPVFTALLGALLFVLPAFLQIPFGELLLGDSYLYAVLIVPFMVLSSWLKLRQSDRGAGAPIWATVGLAAVVVFYCFETNAQASVWHGSRTLYERTTQLYPNWVFGHIGLVETSIAEDEPEPALAHARKAVTVAPEDPTAQFYWGTALLLQDGDRSADAVAPLQKALEADSDWIECLQNVSLALARSGRTDEAIAYLEQARNLRPESPGIRMGLGNAYLRVNRFASARGEFAEALRRRNVPSVHLGLAIAWAANEMPDQARRHLSVAVARDPSIAGRAGRSAHLRKLRDHPGFDGLLEIPDDSSQGDADALPASPAARRARGS